MFCFCFFAFFYKEKWVFDHNKQIMESQFGLLFFYRKKQWKLTELNAVIIYCFLKRNELSNKQKFFFFKPAKVCMLLMEDRQGNQIKLDTVMQHRYNRLLNTGKKLAEFCRIDLIAEDT